MQPSSRGATSLAAMTPKVKRAWYVLALSHEVTHKPIERVLFEVPIVLFRGEDGVVGAFVDRCPHRNVPLSMGTVVGDRLQCAYHGWQFDRSGACQVLPGLPGECDTPARRAQHYVTREQQGFVWVWADRDHAPEGDPFRFRYADDPRYITVCKEVAAPGSVHAVVENALDVPHTAFLHGGLFRKDGDRKPIQCLIRRWHDRVECEFVGEPRPEGLVARFLSPSGGMVTHFDRFFLPSITEVEYQIGEENHILLNGACTPVSDFETRLFAVVSVRSRLPRFLVRAVIQPAAMYIFRQDAVVLARQVETLQRFDEASYVSTDIDLLGPHILRLMHRAARGEPVDAAASPYEKEVEMWV